MRSVQIVTLVLFFLISIAGCSSPVENSSSRTNQIQAPSSALPTARDTLTGWDEKAAASYLDERADWWAGWSVAARDHNTFCVSCHTTVPYVLARPVLRRGLQETVVSAREQLIVQNVRSRVRAWTEIEPYYGGDGNSAAKAVGSRATESVINALILASFDSQNGQLTDDTVTAFDHMWALQKTSGDQKGAWDWQVFGLRPWEAADSQYFGAILAAVAVGTAPSNYATSPGIQLNRSLLRDYLLHNYSRQSLLNRVLLLWASRKLPDLVLPKQRQEAINEAFEKQNPDGGWSLSSVDWTWRAWGVSSIISLWKRDDWTPQETKSDGCATGIFVFALEEAGIRKENPHLSEGLAWLRSNQDKSRGFWPAYSLNKHRDPESNIGRFMTDAATGFAVLALTEADR